MVGVDTDISRQEHGEMRFPDTHPMDNSALTGNGSAPA